MKSVKSSPSKILAMQGSEKASGNGWGKTRDGSHRVQGVDNHGISTVDSCGRILHNSLRKCFRRKFTCSIHFPYQVFTDVYTSLNMLLTGWLTGLSTEKVKAC